MDLTIDESVNDFLDSVTELWRSARQLPSGFDYRFCALDPEFKEESKQLGIRTDELSKVLVSYILDRPLEGDEDDFAIDVDNAIGELLNSPDMKVLDNPPPKQVVTTTIEKKVSGDVTFIYSKVVPKPRKPVKSWTLPEEIPVATSLPTIMTAVPPELTMKYVTYVGTDELLEATCAKITQIYPTGPIYVSFLNHTVRTYKPFHCFCVVMTPDYYVYVIDLIKCTESLQCLVDLLENEDMVKIMYAPEKDLAILGESLGVYVAPVINACCDNVPLAVATQSGYCIVDWRIRPLNEELLLIAARTVFFLPALADGKFRACSVDNIIAECACFAQPIVIESPTAEDIVGGHEGFGDCELALVQSLMTWRDSIAAIEEESPSFIASNEMLLKIADEKPRTVDQLAAVLGAATTPYIDSYRYDLILIVKNVCGADDISEAFNKALIEGKN